MNSKDRVVEDDGTRTMTTDRKIKKAIRKQRVGPATIIRMSSEVNEARKEKARLCELLRQQTAMLRRQREQIARLKNRLAAEQTRNAGLSYEVECLEKGNKEYRRRYDQARGATKSTPARYTKGANVLGGLCYMLVASQHAVRGSRDDEAICREVDEFLEWTEKFGRWVPHDPSSSAVCWTLMDFCQKDGQVIVNQRK